MKRVSEKKRGSKEIFCAIDLHDRMMLAGIATGKDEAVYAEFDTAPDRGVKRLIERLVELKGRRRGSEVYCSYEASGSGFGLSDALEEAGFVCWVLAPSHLPVSRKHRSEKTDRKDVERILGVMRGHVLAGSELPSVWKPDRELRDDREIVRHRLRLGDAVTEVKNRIHGLLKRQGCRAPAGVKPWTLGYMRWLDDLCAAGPVGMRAALGGLVRELRFYQAEEASADEAVRELSRKERYAEPVRALTAAKGIGLLSAMVVLTELGDLSRFSNRKEVGNYLGLTPRSFESGEDDDHKGHISRLGPWRVRKVLNQCAWVAVQWDPYWRDWFRERTEIAGLSAKKKKELRKKMIVAVMRRLGIWMWRTGRSAAAGAAAA